MKLSNAQVAALANKIVCHYRETVVAPLVKKNEEIKKSDEYVNFEKNDPDCKIISELIKKYDTASYKGNDLIAAIKTKFFESRLEKINVISCDFVEQEIHLQTIDSNDLETLIAKVSAKFIA